MLKNKKLRIGLLFFCLLSLGGCKQHKIHKKDTASNSSEVEYQVADSPESDYDYYVGEFEEVNIDQINQKLKNGNQFILFVGQGTCQYCNEFVPKLWEAAKNAKVEIFYWDVENVSYQDSKVVEFSRKYPIEYVPSLIKYIDDKNHFKVFELQGGDETAKDIQAFIETAK